MYLFCYTPRRFLTHVVCSGKLENNATGCFTLGSMQNALYKLSVHFGRANAGGYFALKYKIPADTEDSLAMIWFRIMYYFYFLLSVLNFCTHINLFKYSNICLQQSIYETLDCLQYIVNF